MKEFELEQYFSLKLLFAKTEFQKLSLMGHKHLFEYEKIEHIRKYEQAF